jgi:single-stranded DNA-binding protein
MAIKKRPLNTVLLVGRVCKPPAISTSQSGKPMLTVCLAVNRPEYVPSKVNREVKGGAERVRVEPDFPIVVIEGDLARELSPQVKLGTTLFVRGIFQTRNIEDRSTNPPRKRVAQEVLSNDARVLETTAEVAEARAEQRAEDSVGAPPAPVVKPTAVPSTPSFDFSQDVLRMYPVTATGGGPKKKKKWRKKKNRRIAPAAPAIRAAPPSSDRGHAERSAPSAALGDPVAPSLDFAQDVPLAVDPAGAPTEAPVPTVTHTTALAGTQLPGGVGIASAIPPTVSAEDTKPPTGGLS